MRVIVILVGAIRIVTKVLEKIVMKNEIQKKNRDHLDHSTVKISKNKSSIDLRKLAITHSLVLDLA